MKRSMQKHDTRQSADVNGLKKHSNTDSDVSSQFIIKNKHEKGSLIWTS